MNIINGKPVSREQAKLFLEQIGGVVNNTLKTSVLQTETVVSAADRLSRRLSIQDAGPWIKGLGLSEKSASHMLFETRQFLSRSYIDKKISLELGEDFLSFRDTGGGRQVAFRPLGVLTHITAGNASGLPALSLLEGLLAGNINILKLPGVDDGISTALIRMLIDAEPGLTPYIYVFDFPSSDTDAIKKLLSVSDAAAVWGGDFAVSGIRSIAPPHLRLIEWGHKLSFACVTKKGETKEALMGIAHDICETEQLLCSSPQCVYYEAQDFYDLSAFGERLADAIDAVSLSFPPPPLGIAEQGEITMLLALVSCEELIQNKRVIRGKSCAVIIDENAELCASPKYRTVFVKPSVSLFEELRKKRGYLQTAGAACAPDELETLSEALYRAGVCRVVPCGHMSSSDAGEPHDGLHALRQYMKAVSRD